MKNNVDQTVFVVGAGASCEAGLPSGSALKKTIASLLDIRFSDDLAQISGDEDIAAALRQAALEAGDGQEGFDLLLKKAWTIRDVLPTAAISVDHYLNAHSGDKQLVLCGKLGIVKSILDAERSSKLAPREGCKDGRFNLNDLENTWYISLLQWLTQHARRENAGWACANVSFVTFNYDRCIEHFLVQGLADYYDLTAGEAQAIVAATPIYHVYGSVGLLPWQQSGDSVPFGHNHANLLALARSIKTFTEEVADEAVEKKIQTLIAEAESIVFLGTSFHRLNMEILTPEAKCITERLFATTLGMSRSAVENAEILILGGLLDGRHAEIPDFELTLEQATCGQFFSDFFNSF